MSRGTIAYINIKALQHNLELTQKLSHQAKILAMVKSNGYGHGLLRVAKALNEADGFGVACLTEAVTLRQAGISQPIVVMAGFSEAAEISTFLDYQLSPVIHRLDQITLLENALLKKPLQLWLKIDTGMHRLGLMPEEILAAYKRLNKLSYIQKPIILMTHLADADNADAQFTQMQLEKFQKITADLPGVKSAANSAGILAYPNTDEDWVRPGIMLYGVSPFANRIGEHFGLQPVMTLVAKLMAVKSLVKGDKVGYGCQWSCPENMPVGIVAIGYGDGYPWHAQNGTPVLLGDVICPIIGRVSMDMIAVDLRGKANATIGETALLWGKELPVEKVAQHANTIAYELLTGITARVEMQETK